MALLANDSSDLVDQLILLTRRLADIAERQAQLFDTNRLAEAQPLTDEAGRLSSVYALESRRIAQNPRIIDDADRALKDALVVETKRFREAMAIHEAAIERQRVLAEGLVRAIAQEAVSARPTPIAYGPSANTYRDTSAVALDRQA
ncbi:MAG: hypothetical protein RL186_336 [Pseudomonadota bacterium]|jgi:hypothetical protein